MRIAKHRWLHLGTIIIGSVLLGGLARQISAQVSPSEILNPRLKAAQSAYFPQIKALYNEINSAHFPFTFALGRYVGLDPAKLVGSDARGIEFVIFHDRMILKISGNYNAAYGSERMTQNERANRTFSGVIAPILLLASETIPADVSCDGIGFEISYHVRTQAKNFDYEGKEILVVILDRPDVLAFASATTNSQRQEILNHSDIYLDGKEFGLSLDGIAPLDLDSLDRSGQTQPVSQRPAAQNALATRPDSSPANPPVKLVGIRPQSQLDIFNRTGQLSAPDQLHSEPTPVPATVAAEAAVAPTADDADKLQAKYQTQLDDLAKEGLEKHHFVDYAPPSFVIYRNEIVLQLTLRNTNHFSQDSTSIYKRAAQSFDLFLATKLKDILDKTPADASFEGFDITILNQFGSDPNSSSEAIEFICPRSALRHFVEADITNQQLIDQSIVLVNGVRIALNLQLVE
ncbi:MAG TPA: hypothetical protein VN774_01695 [Candidatus Limnocylindrales bacterium]|nr:hypothetical protein [Candidatus Limnocylindrales bacterium]